MITQKNGIFNLSSNNTTYLISITKNKHLEHLYYGSHLNEDSISKLALTPNITSPLGTATLYEEDKNENLNVLRQEISTPGKGDYRDSSIVLSYNEGMTTLDLIFSGYKILLGKPRVFSGLPESYGTKEECDTLEIILKDKELPIKVTLYYSVFKNSDVIVRKTIVQNDSKANITIEKLASLQLDLNDSDYDLITFDGAWARERHITRRAITRGKIVNESRTGVSSASHNPCIYLAKKSCDYLQGECYATNLVYSSNHKESVEVNDYNQTRLLTGINDSTFKWILLAGDRFVTPEAILTYSQSGFNGISKNFHSFINQNIVRGEWKNRIRPILVNNWEATYFHFNDKKLLKLAKEAKDIGAELFVLDDGWFGVRDNDECSLGDWQVNTTKLKGGLRELSNDIHKMGLLFGLWVEPEMISRNSNLFDKHPDWAIMIPGRAPSVGRHQFILDLTNHAVIDYLEIALTKIFKLGNVDYIKWDMNRVFSDIYSSNRKINNFGEFYHRYILGLYDLLTRLVKTFPNILFESCASGGNRFDLGMLCYMPQTWTSDCTDTYERTFIQEGTYCGYPLSTMGCHVTTSPNHQTLRKTDLDSRFNVAAFGNLGYELDLINLTKDQKDTIKDQILFYKRFRTTLQYGTIAIIKSIFDNNNDATWAVMNRDKSEIIVLDFVGRVHPNQHPKLLRIPVVNEEYTYDIFNRQQQISLKSFGSLINHVSPIEITEGSNTEKIATKIIHLSSEISHYKVTGELLAKAGIFLNQEFGGLGYDDINTKVIYDNGSRLYVIKKSEV